MLDLGSVRAIIDTFSWMLTLGHSDVARVKTEIDELIRELSKSLTSLWDIVREVTKTPEADLTKDKFAVTIGGGGTGGTIGAFPANIVTLYEGSIEYVLEVAPSLQAAVGL